jgi:hypothetical protein
MADTISEILGFLDRNDGHSQWENQDEDGRTSSGETQQRSWEYEDGGDEQKAEKNGGVFSGRPGS